MKKELVKSIENILAVAPERRAHAIIEADNTAEIMEAIAPQDAYLIIKESWEDDGQILLQYVNQEKLRTFFDLDCWLKDEFSLEDLVEWLWTLLEVSSEKAVDALAAMDIELLIMFFQHYLEITHVNPTDDDIPDLLADGFESMDNTYFFRFKEGGEEADLVRSVIKLLFNSNQQLYAGIMINADWEMPSQMEESAYANRSLRMMELGFPSMQESLTIYRKAKPAVMSLDEKKVPRSGDEGYSLPVAYREPLKSGGELIISALQQADPETSDRLLFEMVYLSNKIMMADYKAVNDSAAFIEAGSKAKGLLSIGLAWICREQDVAADAVLKSANAETLFSLGYNLVLEQQERVKGRKLDLLPHDMLDKLEGLQRRRPRFGNAEFSSLQELDEVRGLIDEWDVMQRLCDELQVAEGLDYESIILTGLAVNILSGEHAFRPLSRAEFIELVGRVTQGADPRRVVPAFKDDLAALINAGATGEAVAARLVRRLDDEIGAIDLDRLESRYITCMLIK